MATEPVRARDKDTLAEFLGWFSIGLGTAQVAAPGLLCRVIGARGEGASRTLMRLIGLRELTVGLGILMRPRPTNWVWARVAGDAVDLSLLGLTAAQTDSRTRTAFGIANVAAVAAADVYEGRYLSSRQGEPRTGKLVRKSVTINRPRREVEQAWVAAEETRRKVDEAGASVRFDEAPGNRGTELVVEWMFAPPAGDLGAAAAKLTGRDLATQLSDELRRLKQELETGEVIRSDGVPSGHLLAEQLRQRAAKPREQPLEEVVR